MKLWKHLLISAAVLCLVIPFAFFAVAEEPAAIQDELPSFQNEAQAKHAENLTDAFVAKSADELADLADKEATSYAQDEATKFIDQKAQDYADGVMQDAAKVAATELIENKVDAYAEETALTKTGLTEPPDVKDPNYRDYRSAYAEAKLEAEARAYGDFGEGNKNAYQTAVDAWLADPNNQQIGDEAKAYALKRAYGDFGEDHKNAYQKTYERFYSQKYDESLVREISRLTDVTYREIWTMRFKEKKGLGLIAKELGIERKVLGLGHTKKLQYKERRGVTPPEVENNPEVEIDSFDAEIAEATKRSRTNGWYDGYGASTKQKGNAKKTIGLTQTSVAAGGVISETVGGKGKSSNGKSGSSMGSSKSDKADQSQTSLSNASGRSGKDNNNGKSGVSNSGKSNGNSGKSNGNSGKSNGNSGKSNGNSGKSNGNGKK